jgi:hypothetical protein
VSLLRGEVSELGGLDITIRRRLIRSQNLIGTTVIWLVFWLMAYFYLNAKRHDDRVRARLLNRIPKAGIFLVGLGTLSDFPEYEHVRRLLPLSTLAAERVLTAFDLTLIVALTLLVAFDRWLRLPASDPEDPYLPRGDGGLSDR